MEISRSLGAASLSWDVVTLDSCIDSYSNTLWTVGDQHKVDVLKICGTIICISMGQTHEKNDTDRLVVVQIGIKVTDSLWLLGKCND